MDTKLLKNENVNINESVNDINSDMKPFVIDPVMDVDLFVKANNCPEITNPIFFSAHGVPTDDGLLSNTLFGTTRKSRANIFGYINLNDVFIHPLVYDIWSKMDKNISDIVWSDDEYKVDSNGDIKKCKPGESGESGIRFLKNNFDKIVFKESDSKKRHANIEFIKSKKNTMFITKFIVMPPFIRDVLVSEGKTEVGELNKMYQKILINAKSLKSLSEYGIEPDARVRGSIQEEMRKLYIWLKNEPNLGQKKGIIRRAVLTKTTDYASRLVMSSPNLNVESPKALRTTMDYSTVPLASLCANVKPFLLFWLRNVFNNAFSGTGILLKMNSDSEDDFTRLTVDNFEEQFNDDRYEKEISRFIEGYSNRFAPVTFEANGKVIPFGIKLNGETRPLTWCELFYMGVHDVIRGKHVLITRYPIDSLYSQFPCRVRCATTIKTEVIKIGETIYNEYPYIRARDIGKDTSNKFKDTASIFNPYLGSILGDYDGDQIGIKVIFSDEANDEAEKHLQSKLNYIDFSGKIHRKSSNEAIQCMFNLTMILPDDKKKLGVPIF